MSCDVEAELRERLGMKPQEFDEYFVVDEVKEDIVIAIREDSKGKPVWLERGTWLGVNDYAKEKDGEWHKDKGCWTIPIESIKQSKPTEDVLSKPEPSNMPLPNGEPIPVKLAPETPKPTEDILGKESEEPEDEAEYLRPTFEAIGELTQVLVTPNGQVIDGKHRLALNPSWEKRILTRLNDPVKAAIGRLVINVVRRTVPAQEKTELLTEIAKLTGWTPQQIAQSTGMSTRWVLRYLPEEFKQPEKVEAGKAGAEAIREKYQEVAARLTPESEEIRQPEFPAAVAVECENCHVQTYFPKDFQGRQLCSRCYDKAIQQPEAFTKKIKKVGREVPETKPIAKPKPSEIDVGEFLCPECHEKYLLVHMAPGKHWLRRIGKGGN